MQKKKIALLTSIAAIVASVAFTGCRTDASTSPSNANSPVMPKTGTTYTSTETDQDQSNSTSATVISTVVQTGLTYAGKSSVTEVINSQDGTPRDTMFMRYESNGDVSVYLGELSGGTQNPELWTLYPFESQQTSSFSIDVTLDVNGSSVPGVVSITNTGAGTGSVTIMGKTYATRKLRSEKVITSQGSTLETLTSQTEFAPGIGWIVRNDQASNFGTSHASLLSFSLK